MNTNDNRNKSRSHDGREHALQGRIHLSANEQALWAQMQDLGYSHGLCLTALHILSQDKRAVSDMLAFIHEEQPSEDDFIKEMARICDTSWID